MWAAGIAAVAAIIVALINVVASGGSGEDSARGPVGATGATIPSVGKNNCGNGSTIKNSTVSCGDTGRVPAGPSLSTADAGCGTVGGDPAARLRLRVVMWCAPEAVRGQYEFKLKVSVNNTGSDALDITRERFVLLWRTLNPSRWSPPRGGAPAPPRRVTWASRDYWAIFANPDGIAESNGAVGGFATHWSYTTLAPGRRSLRPRRGSPYIEYSDEDHVVTRVHFNRNEDDLVFYVPKATVDRDRNFLGLGYLRGGRVIAVCPQGKWGPKVPPASF